MSEPTIIPLEVALERQVNLTDTIDVDGQFGRVRLVEFMGNDSTVANAARNSTSGGEVKRTSTDEQLIRYLMRHRHDTPFEFVQFIFEVKMPIFVARQLVRHRTQGINEMSARYSVLPEEFYVAPAHEINLQATNNKQGRLTDSLVNDAVEHEGDFRVEAEAAFLAYKGRIDDGMARETARNNLPLSTYTQWWTTMNLRNALWMCGLRLNPHAQLETRRFAQAMSIFIKRVCPVVWQAFDDYVLNAMTFTAAEVDRLRLIITQQGSTTPFSTSREKEEWDVKLAKLQKVI